jgi:DNA mismatch repair ATPase MutS
MIAILNLLDRVKKEFIPLFGAVGKLDALLSIAKLYKEREGQEAQYGFASYRKSDRPLLSIQNFWNPFLDPEQAVTNNIDSIGQGKGRCFVFTGPNASGKSTAMKSISINVLMAQTLGIASGRTELSPFSYIVTHFNVTDDISSKKSLYVSEIAQIKDILDKSKELLKQNKFVILNVDEWLNTTNSKSATAIARSIGKYLANNLQNCVCIVASHLNDITKLESDTNGVFKNYKTVIEKEIVFDEYDNQKTEINYTYKLVPGVVDESIAIDILSDVGIDREIIDGSWGYYG